MLDYRRRRRSGEVFQRNIPDASRWFTSKTSSTLPKITAGGAQNYGDTVDLTEVGSGIIDWKKIFAQSDKAGIKHYIVEHDHPKQPLRQHHQKLPVLE